MIYHNSNLDKFIIEPSPFCKFDTKATLMYSLGATLYMPGTTVICTKILEHKLKGVGSIVLDLEDAVQISNLDRAEECIIYQLNELLAAINRNSLSFDEMPLIFIRLRSTAHFEKFSMKLSQDILKILTGFCFPKITSNSINNYISIFKNLQESADFPLYFMPILEGDKIAYKESRFDELFKIHNILSNHYDSVLNIRVGGTDISSAFGLRRGINYSIYDIQCVSECLSDIINIFKRDQKFVVSGPVWEYFYTSIHENITTDYDNELYQSILMRSRIVNQSVDGLLREVILDRANGFVGKTIIHPSHARYVNALQSVVLEEYEDANQILSTSGGVVKSKNNNKMNEINPHKTWAYDVINRAKAYGVIKSENEYKNLFSDNS